MITSSPGHAPVMLDEVLAHLSLRKAALTSTARSVAEATRRPSWPARPAPLGDRPRSGRDRARGGPGCAEPRPAASGARTFRIPAFFVGRIRRENAGWRCVRPRRVILSARSGCARLQLPCRRPARHADGTGWADGGRSRQRLARGRTGRHALRTRRGAPLTPDRSRDRRRARGGADHHAPPSSPRLSGGSCQPTDQASIPRRGASRRCASG